jgi:hypothetical protein
MRTKLPDLLIPSFGCLAFPTSLVENSNVRENENTLGGEMRQQGLKTKFRRVPNLPAKGSKAIESVDELQF